jgi:membrane-associated phospholipid phosphatase
MGKILAALPWAVGIGVIFLIAGILASRIPRPEPAVPGPARRRAAGPRRPAAGAPVPARQAVRDAWPDVLRFLAIVAAGAALIWALMSLVGLIVTHAGPTIDKPIYNAIVAHREHLWKALMTRATKIGDTWTIRGTAVTAAVCLAVSWRRRRWLPPLALGAMAVLQRVLTVAIHHTIHRVGPPQHIHGTFPSGGSERCVVFYGLIAYLLWREFSGSRRAAIWSGAVVAALAYSEGYSRVYLSMHWFTDVLSGWFYGCLLLAMFITAVHMVAGPARKPHSGRPRGQDAAIAAGAGAAARPNQRIGRPAAVRPAGNGTASRATAAEPDGDGAARKPGMPRRPAYLVPGAEANGTAESAKPGRLSPGGSQ